MKKKTNKEIRKLRTALVALAAEVAELGQLLADYQGYHPEEEFVSGCTNCAGCISCVRPEQEESEHCGWITTSANPEGFPLESPMQIRLKQVEQELAALRVRFDEQEKFVNGLRGIYSVGPNYVGAPLDLSQIDPFKSAVQPRWKCHCGRTSSESWNCDSSGCQNRSIRYTG